MWHKTQVHSSPFRDEVEDEVLAPRSESDSDPYSCDILARTPPATRTTEQKCRRDLLPHLHERENSQEDLANELPRWMADIDKTTLQSLAKSSSNTPKSGCSSGSGTPMSGFGSTPLSRSSGSKTRKSGFGLTPQSGSNTPMSGFGSTPLSGSNTPISGFGSTPQSSLGRSSGSDSTSQTSKDKSVLQQILLETVSKLQEEPLVAKKRKITPSREVRDVVRKVYRSLVESDENFGWELSEPIQNTSNKLVMQKLVTESKLQLPDTTSAMINEAAKTYFGSVSGIQRLKASGKYEEKCIQQRRRNRLIRKVKARKAALQKTSAITENEKPKWLDCLVPEMVSSEESEDDSFIVRPLAWRSDKATSFMMSLDRKNEKRMSKKSKIMTCVRTEGLPSDRPKPSTDVVPAWAIKP